MAYPSSYSSVDGTSLVATADHAAMHNAIETVVGTCSGTNVLKNFVVGDHAVRINTSNVLQQALQGTINNSVMGSPTITGGAFNSGTFGTVKINQGSDAEGDLYYRNSSGAFTRLAVGASGNFLTTNGVIPSWGTVPTAASGVSVTASALGTIAGSATTKVAFDTEVYDLGNEYDTTNKRFVAASSGKYMVTASVMATTFDTNSRMDIDFYINGAASKAVSVNSGTTSSVCSVHGAAILNITAPGTIEIYIYNGGAGNFVHTNDPTVTWMMIQRMS